MPNYCEVDIRLDGPKADLEKLKALVGLNQTPPKFSFDAILPYPEPFRSRDQDAREFGIYAMDGNKDGFLEKYGNLKDGYNTGGYEWCVANWGSKWQPSDVKLTHFGISYQIPWSDGRQTIQHLHRLFPSVSIHVEYFERGAGFCGGYSLLPSEYSNIVWTEWRAGTIENEWSCREYRGVRGG